MVEQHVRLDADGIMILGTCGEGPWLTENDRRILVEETVRANRGRLKITVQATENSAVRTLEQIEVAASLGADYATVAQPAFLLNATPANVEAYYLDIFERSPLPVIFYDRGLRAPVPVPTEMLETIFLHPRVAMVKDSSTSEERRDVALRCRQQRPELVLLTGNEFGFPAYLEAGYDGGMMGGAILTARYVRAIAAAVKQGNRDEAEKLDDAMKALLWAVYGGTSIACWLTGLKEALVRLGVFSTNANILKYPITPECSAAIDAALESERRWIC